MDIQELRKDIDRVDEELVELFRRRMQTSVQIAEYKKENNLPVYDPARERDKLANVCAQAGDELEDYTRVLYHGSDLWMN